MSGDGFRKLTVSSVARVEGEGAVELQLQGPRVARARLRIYEPPRFFEAFLVGRDYREPPDLTSRVCGICPVAYQLTACQALEAACGLEVGGQLAALRRLLYCGEWIESQSLHIYLLHAPDFLGCADMIELARSHRGAAERGLRLKQAGNAIIEKLGGRAIHPVSVRLGGFHRVPTRDEMRPLAETLQAALDDAWATVRWVAGFDFPDAHCDADFLALTTPGTYAIECGRPTALRTDETRVRHIPLPRFTDHVVEEQVPHSTALHSRLDGRRHLTGSLARYALSGHLLSPAARQAASEATLPEPAPPGTAAVCRNPYRSILVRAVEVFYAIEEALRLIGSYEPPSLPSLPVGPREGEGHAATEAPRGLLYHRYLLDGSGRVREADLVPPTAQNQGAIEEDLRREVQDACAAGEATDAQLTALAERVIRNHDPCISCSAHFLRMAVVRS